MGCTSSQNAHPESKIYDLLEQLSCSIENHQISDDKIRLKIEKYLTKIETILMTLHVVSPFISMEIQITLDKLQKSRPKVYKSFKDQFLKLKEQARATSKKPPLSPIETTQERRLSNSSHNTAPPSPFSHSAKYARADKLRLSADSAASTQMTSRNASAEDPIVILPNPIRLKSFYQNTSNHSQETLGDFGFFDDEERKS